jgi:hypothetical protein
VISIIALLISILLPALGSARERARFIKWAGFSFSIRTDQRLRAYYNWQEQDGTQRDSAGTLELWNRAAGNAMEQAREDIEPQDFNAKRGSLPATQTFPIWQDKTPNTRWRGKGGQQFNGTTSALEIRRIDVVKVNFTVVAWLTQPNATAGVGTAAAQWWNGSGIIDGEVSGSARDWGLALVANQGHLGMGPGASGSDVTAYDGKKVNDGKYHMIAATRKVNGAPGTNTSATAVFTDDAQTAAFANQTTASNDARGTTGSTVNIGCLQTDSNYFTGFMDEIQVWSEVLPADELTSIYKVGAARSR